MTEEPLDLERLRAFVRGELDDAARASVEALLDRRPDARRVLGVLAREGGRATDRDPYVGALLGGRYRIERRLGAGGMGAVYAAEHELLGRKVALKLLHPELGDRAEVRRRFEHEARAAASIDHPNVVGALDVGRTPDGAPFVVLELLAGVDLERHLATHGPLPVPEARAIGAAIAEGLSAAHARGIVHRDLKPANVFLAQPDPRRPPVPKILDFGISKLHDGLGTATGAFMGTPAYMAPEQLRDASSVDPRADLYALGVVLFRMLTGALPHPHGSLGELLAAHDREPPSPRALRPELPPDLDALVRRCLAPRREDRPDDAASVAQALAPTTRPPSAFPPAPERRLVMALFASVSLDRRTVEEAGGRVVRDDVDGSLAIFGESAWTGELHDAALRVALGFDAPDALFVVGAARLDRTRDVLEGSVLEGSVLEGSVLEGNVAETFAKARRRGARGVLVSPELRSAFPSVALEELAPGLHRVASTLASSEATFVGRALERARIRDAFERVVDELSPAALVLEGPPGVGKSRLVRVISRELASERRELPRARVLVARARLDRLEESELLRGWLEDADLDDLPEQLGRRGLSEHEPSLRLLLGESASAAVPHDVQLVADRVRLSALALLTAFATERPLVLVVEDARSAGSSAIALLERILERTGPILVLVVSRLPLALAGPHVETVQLRGLRRREVAELASALGVTLDDTAIAALHERTEGNPFFVEQLVRGPTDSMPASVEAAVQARLDALPSDERELLARASIVGDAFSNADLVALGVEAPEARLASLRKSELVVRVHASGATRHRIGSELVESTAYRALPPELRRELHLAFARHLASACPSSPLDAAADRTASATGPDAARPGHTPSDIARHFDRAGAEEAGAWHERAAEEAARIGDGAAVIVHAERARALGRFGADRQLAEAYELAGRLDDEARVIDEGPVTPERLARSAVNRWRRGHVEEALALFARAEVEGESASASERASVLGRHAVALIYAGRHDDARRRLDEAERLVLVRAPELRAEAAIWRAQLAAAAGDLGDRRNAYWAAVELYGERGDRRRRAQAAVNLADVYNRLGAYDEAETALRDALDDCAALGLSHAAAYAHANLAYAHLRRTRFEDAEHALVAARSLAASIGDRRLDDVLALYRLRAAAARGHDVRDEAAALGAALEESSLALAALAFTCAAASALAHAHEHDALAWAERASRHLASLGTLEEDEAEVALVHARALDALGRSDEAREIRSLARATLLAAARRIADPEWRERWLREVPAHRELLATI